MKINRRGFFAALLAPLLAKKAPGPWDGLVCQTHEILPDPIPIGEFDDISVSTLTALNGYPVFADVDIMPVWSGEIFPTYGSIKRNGTLDAPIASKEEES